MSAEAIARVISDLRKGKVIKTTQQDTFDTMIKTTKRGPVVDVTAIFRSVVVDAPRTIALYEDHPSIIPPWPYAQFAWVNTFDREGSTG